jgi:hypothetical protein
LLKQALLPFLPALLAALLCGLGIVATAMPRAAASGRRVLAAGIAALGVLTLAAALWQAAASRSEIAHLVRNDPARALAVEVKSLETQLASLKESTRARALGPDTAKQLADYLRPLGSHKVVVSCAPGDIEAYHYATQIADALKAGGWDARGPETTSIFGEIDGMAINVYANGAQGADTAKLLLDGLRKFGIPYQSRVPPSEAMPATDAVELFIGRKPQPPALAAAAPGH